MQGELVRLRPLRREDADVLYKWITTRELVLLNSSYYPVSEADHEEWINSMMRRRADIAIFVIEDKSSDTAIGTCQLLNIDMRHRNAELQIRIGEDSHQGQGFGSEAVRLLCDFGFRDLNLHRIYLRVFTTNTRAISAYKKCGFKEEGVSQEAAFIDGAWVNVLGMGLLSKYE